MISYLSIWMFIKQRPEDFIVEEKITLERVNNGKYIYVKMTKKGWNTLDVIHEIAKRVHVKKQDIGFAGLKDKQGITTQYISLPSYVKNLPEIRNVSYEIVGQGNKPIRVGDNEGNSFKINIHENIPPITIDWVENYFGEQRFSTENSEKGKKIITKTYTQEEKKEFEQTEKNILLLYVHSYQSLLWNKIVAKYIEKNIPDAEEHEGLHISQTYIEKNIPLLAFDTEWDDKEIHELYNKIMNEEQITQEDFIIRAFPQIMPKTEQRKVCVGVTEWKQEGTIVTLTLPKGAYATTVLKKLAWITKQKQF